MNINKEIEQAWEFSDSELYELLGLGALKDSLKAKGERTFDKFKLELKEVICADDGPYGFVKGEYKDEKSLAAAIFATILAGSSIGTDSSLCCHHTD